MWSCTRPLQSVHAEAELECRGRVVFLVSYVMSAAGVGRVILDYCCNVILDCCTGIILTVPVVAYKSYQVPGNYVIPGRLYLNLCLQPRSLDLSEARNDHGCRVKLEFKKICDKTAPF